MICRPLHVEIANGEAPGLYNLEFRVHIELFWLLARDPPLSDQNLQLSISDLETNRELTIVNQIDKRGVREVGRGKVCTVFGFEVSVDQAKTVYE